MMTAHNNTVPASSDDARQLDDLRALIAHITGPAPMAPGTPARDWFVAQRGVRAKMPVLHPRLSIFAGARDNADRADLVRLNIATANINMMDGPLTSLCRMANTDLRLYDLSPGGSARDTASFLRACAYGMVAVETGVDLWLATALGAGHALATKHLLGNTATDPADPANPIDALLMTSSSEIAALTGLTLACALAQKPLVLEGAVAHAIVQTLARANPAAIAHVLLVLDTAYDAGMTPLPCPTLRLKLDPDVPGLGAVTSLQKMTAAP